MFLNHNQIVVCDNGSDHSRVQIFEYLTSKLRTNLDSVN